MWNFVATEAYAPFNSHVGGGARAVYTMCKNSSVLADDGFPNLAFCDTNILISKKRVPYGSKISFDFRLC